MGTSRHLPGLRPPPCHRPSTVLPCLRGRDQQSIRIHNSQHQPRYFPGVRPSALNNLCPPFLPPHAPFCQPAPSHHPITLLVPSLPHPIAACAPAAMLHTRYPHPHPTLPRSQRHNSPSPNVLASTVRSRASCLSPGRTTAARYAGGRPYRRMLSTNTRMAATCTHALNACRQSRAGRHACVCVRARRRGQRRGAAGVNLLAQVAWVAWPAAPCSASRRCCFECHMAFCHVLSARTSRLSCSSLHYGPWLLRLTACCSCTSCCASSPAVAAS